MATANPRRGYILGLTAYIIWGLFPLYFKAIQAVPALEIIAHRAIWSALFGALLLALSDYCAQRLFMPYQLPVGVVTVSLGGIYLIGLLIQESRKK